MMLARIAASFLPEMHETSYWLCLVLGGGPNLKSILRGFPFIFPF